MLLLWCGFQMQAIARGFLVYEMTGSAKILGLVGAGGSLPFLVLGPFAGAIADRVERKRLIQIGHGAVAVVRLLVAVSITTGTVNWVILLVASMIQGALVCFMLPAGQALVPQIVGRDKLSNAIALNAAGMSTASLVGPALGGVLYAIVGPDGVYYAIWAMALASMALTISIPRTVGAARRSYSSVLGDIKAGLLYMRATPLVLVLLAIGVANLHLTAPLSHLLPVFVVDVYHGEAAAFGLLLSMIGLGSLVGALGCAALGRRRRGWLLIMGSFTSGAAMLLVASVSWYFAAVGFMVVLGLGSAVHQALNQALVLENVEDEYRGRVISIFMMHSGLVPFGVLLAAVAIDELGGQFTIGVLAVALLAVSTDGHGHAEETSRPELGQRWTVGPGPSRAGPFQGERRRVLR